jgi:hypothetical protein
MLKAISTFCLCLAATSGACVAQGSRDYTGPFTTKALYVMCSSSNKIERDKCNFYLQGLMYGLKMARFDGGKLQVCLPEMNTEAARLRIVQFINATTGGKPETNGDSGDWVAFMGLAAGNLCK